MSGYLLDLTRLEPYECAAQLITLIALPVDTANEGRRDELHTSLCHIALREMHADIEAQRTPQPMKPVYAFCDLDKALRQMARLARLLRWRSAAGHMAIPFAQEVQLGHPPPLPTHIERLSLSQMAVEVMEMALHSDIQNVYNRVWRVSKPVLHLCVALRVTSVDFYKLYGRGLSCVDLMLDADLLRHVVGFAEDMAEVLPRNPRLNLDPERLIRVRLKT